MKPDLTPNVVSLHPPNLPLASRQCNLDRFALSRAEEFAPAGSGLPSSPRNRIRTEPFAKAEVEIRQANLIGVSVEDRSTAMVHAEILAVDPEPIDMGITPAESKLDCIVKICNTLVGTKQEPTPDQWANAA